MQRILRLISIVLSGTLPLACTSGEGDEPSGSNTGGSAATGGEATGGINTGGTTTTGGVGGAQAPGGGAGGVWAIGGTEAAGGAESAGGMTSAGGPSTAGGSPGQPDITLPPANAPFDYQIGGAYSPPAGVQVVSRDREDPPAAGIYNICYVNGFQIQPHEESWWLNSHPDLILRDTNGNPIVDAGWDEMLVDVTTPAKRDAAAAIVGTWIAQCAADGFDAVEIDNLDSYSRSEGLITQSDNIAFMSLLADIAHANGLAAAQKNSTEFLDDIAAMHTDFAVAEECNRWNECGDYQTAYGNLVFVIEYRSQDFNAGCTDFPGLSIVLRDLDVTPPSSGSYVYDAC